MSHIPNSAMKHAAPTHHAEEAKPAKAPPRAGISGSLLALGGTLLVGAVAAVAVPLWRSRATAGEDTAPRKAARKPAAKRSGKAAVKHSPASTAKSDAKTASRKSTSRKEAEA